MNLILRVDTEPACQSIGTFAGWNDAAQLGQLGQSGLLTVASRCGHHPMFWGIIGFWEDDMAESAGLEAIENFLCLELQPLSAGKVTAESALASIGVDSLKLVSLILAIEQKFGVNLMVVGMQPADMESVRSLAMAVKAGRGD